MKDIEEVRAFIRKALEPVYNNERYGKPLIHDPKFARFWEGRMVEVKYNKEDLETLLEMLSEDTE